MHWRRLLIPAMTVALALTLASAAAAGEHVGIVTLAAVPVPGARVTASNGASTLTVHTNGDGIYRFGDLADGVWSITVEMLGFSPQTREVMVTAGGEPERWSLTVLPFEVITRDVPLPPPSEPPAAPGADRRGPAAARGPQSGSTAAAPDAFRRAGVTGGAAPAGRPANAPAPAPAGAPALPDRSGFLDEAPVASGDSFLVNGTVSNSAAAPTPQPLALGNVRRLLGIRLYTGSVFFNGGSAALDATPHSLTGLPAPKRDYRDVNVTVNFGGPFRIPGLIDEGPNLTFNYQRSSNTSANTLSETMPTPLERSGDFSQTLDGFGRPVQIVDPATGVPFPGNAIPVDRLSPQALALLRHYPLPDPGATGTFNYQLPAVSARRQDLFRINVPQVITTSRYQFGAGGGYTRSSSSSTSLFGFDNGNRGSGVDAQVNWAYRVALASQMRVRYTFNRQSSETEPHFANLTNVSGDAGITGNNQDAVNWGPPRLQFVSGIAGLSDTQYSRTRNHSHVVGGESLRGLGRHALTFGANVRHQRLDLVSQQNPRGTFTFNGSASGYDFADFLLGVPNTSSIAYGNADKHFRSWVYDVYVTDDFRVSPNFTIQVGVRWDYETPIRETLGRLVNLDVAPDFSAAAPVIAGDGTGPITGRRYPETLVQADRFGFQPRFGLAWRPIVGSSIVVRGGYGLYRNSNVYQSIASVLSQQPPLSRTFNAVNTPETPLTLANGFVAPESSTLNTFAIDPAFRVGAVHRWQASVQRDLPASLTATATYIGGKGFDLLQAFLPNTYAPGAANPCPSCPSGFVYITSHGDSAQHSAQLQIRRRLRGGLTWTTSYTLGTATDNASGFSGVGAGGTGGVAIAQDWLDLDAERGPSPFDQRHQFNVQVTYTTGQGVAGGALLTGWKGVLVKGWTLTSSLNTGSGSPLTPTYRVPNVGGVTGTVRASLTGEPVDAAPDGYFLNPSAYGPPAAGTWGDAGRNSLRGPRPFNLDAGMTRTFTLPNRLTLNWQLNASNVLNRVTYSAIDTSVGSSRFGLPVATAPARTVRTSLRLSF